MTQKSVPAVLISVSVAFETPPRAVCGIKTHTLSFTAALNFMPDYNYSAQTPPLFHLQGKPADPLFFGGGGGGLEEEEPEEVGDDLFLASKKRSTVASPPSKPDTAKVSG